MIGESQASPIQPAEAATSRLRRRICTVTTTERIVPSISISHARPSPHSQVSQPASTLNTAAPRPPPAPNAIG